MARKRKKTETKEMLITDAVDHLSEMAELDTFVEEEGKGQGVKKRLHHFEELQETEKEETVALIKKTFQTVHQYFKHVYAKDQKALKDREMQRGIKAIMVLADEAADKLKTCTSLLTHTHGEGSLSEIQEYQDLKTYFKKNILKRFEEVLDAETKWEEEWSLQEEKVDVDRQGLKDLEMVKRDQEYELFYIRKDDGKPFFNRNLLRHIKLVSDFDEMITDFQGEDPLLHINVLLDHEAQNIAEEIRESAKVELEDFYAHALSRREIPIVSMTLKMTISLMLACNPHNLSENVMGKVCTRYLKDFHQFLRELLASPDYQELINVSEEEIDDFSRAIIHLIHAFSFAFFTHSGKKQEMLDYLHHLISRSHDGKSPVRTQKISTDQLFSEILDIHDHVTEMLKKFPSGPLFKTLDSFQDQDKKEGFDPINQGNPPYFLYTFSSSAFESSCLKIPCPTIHSYINKAEVIDEFKGFLRHFEEKEGLKRHLHFNLQDRTSSKEYARCNALEKLQRKAEFSKQFVLVTLPKKNDFYFQTEDYLEVDQAIDFLKLLERQIKSGEECGFFFSKQIDEKMLHAYIEKLIPIIHREFFENKAKLPRKDRLDFIEIFYLFLELKILEIIQPDTFTFSCKDGVDIGATSSAAFFTMLKLLGKHHTWNTEEQDHLLWILCGPALTVRERLIDYQRLSRTSSALSILGICFRERHDLILKALQPLFGAQFFQKIQGEFYTGLSSNIPKAVDSKLRS